MKRRFSQNPPAAAPHLYTWETGLLLVLLTVAAFLPTLANEFVDWDDDQNFLGNLSYRGLGWPQVTWMFTAYHMGHYIPLTWLSFGLN